MTLIRFCYFSSITKKLISLNISLLKTFKMKLRGINIFFVFNTPFRLFRSTFSDSFI